MKSRAENDSEYVDNLRSQIRKHLYGSKVTLKGRLLEKLGEFSYITARRGHSVTFVTPNYDEYLDVTLENLPFRNPESVGGDITIPTLRSHISIDQECTKVPDSWTNPYSVHCVHVHGIVGQEAGSQRSNRGVPVLGELEYAESSSRTEGVLTELFTDRNILIVGSSLRDGPLVNALITSGNQKSGMGDKRRIVVQPMQGPEWQVPESELDGILDLNRDRRDALKLTNTRPQFFCQSAQLMSEISSAIVNGDGMDMKRSAYESRYDNRLDNWWHDWAGQCTDKDEVHSQHHEWLRVACESSRTILGAKPDEQIKIECWVRWKPSTDRELALWASSVGTWVNEGSMRRAKLASDEKYSSVAIFRRGAPQILQASDPNDRWRSYFGLPIWLDTPVRSAKKPSPILDQLPVGVMILASMWEGDAGHDGHAAGCIGEQNLKKLAMVASTLEVFGAAILDKSRMRGDNVLLKTRQELKLEYAPQFEKLNFC